MRSRILCFFFLCLALAAISASAQVAYSNGLCKNNGTDCTTDAWTINFGYVVSDQFRLSSATTVTGVDFDVWAFPGDRITSVDWSITSAEFGGTTYGSGTASTTLTKDLGGNQYGYDMQLLTFSTGSVPLAAGMYWLNLQNAVVNTGDPVYWDENSGPSMASQSALGSIPSESFDVMGTSSGTTNGCPEPGSIMLFSSGILGIAGWLRRQML